MWAALGLLWLAMLGGASAQRGMPAPGPEDAEDAMPGTAAILPGTSKVAVEGASPAGTLPDGVPEPMPVR